MHDRTPPGGAAPATGDETVYMKALDRLALPIGWETRVLVSDRRRSIGLTVDEHAHLTITVPAGTDPARLARVIREKRLWVYRKVREQSPYVPDHPVKELVSGEGFNLFDRHRRLRLVDDGPPIRSDDTTKLTSWSGVPIREIHLRRDHAHRPDTLIGWYAAEGRRLLGAATGYPRTLGYWTARTRLTTLPKLDITRLPARRWARYNRRRHILQVDWAVFQLDYTLIDFVVARELCKAATTTDRDAATRLDMVFSGAAQTAERLLREGARAWIGEIKNRAAGGDAA